MKNIPTRSFPTVSSWSILSMEFCLKEKAIIFLCSVFADRKEVWKGRGEKVSGMRERENKPEREGQISRHR